MASISTNQFKAGVKFMFDGQPYAIIENEFVKPGKGQAFNRVRVRNLLNGRVIEKTFKSGETFAAADVTDLESQYLYNDGEFWHFMDPATYEQIAVEKKHLDDVKQWLKARPDEGIPWLDKQDISMITLWNGSPILVTPPNFVILQVIETDPGMRGDTVSGGTKPAKLETGATVQVPLFVVQGEYVRVDTRINEYMARIT